MFIVASSKSLPYNTSGLSERFVGRLKSPLSNSFFRKPPWFAYKESKGDKHKEDDERKIAKQVAEISARAMSGSAAEEVQAKEDGNSRKDNEVPRRRADRY